MKDKGKMFFFGGVIGLLATILVLQGNPGNMGLCIACFWRDIAGAVGLHKAPVVQYIRPEIIGIVFGAFCLSMIKGEFKVKGGSGTAIRFMLGFFTMVGALVFLGCPLRMVLRIANGDLNAIVGMLGYIVGIAAGVYFLKNGYSLGASNKQATIGGYSIPALALVLLIFLLMAPSFIAFSAEGPGSKHAPIAISLIAGIVVGAILQNSRLCTAGAFRDIIIMRDPHYLVGIIGIILIGLVANLVLNPAGFNLSFTEQPVAHSEHLWNFLGMVLVGLCACLLGGCPIRQTVLAAQGDTDAVITVFGLIVGAAFCHNFGLASSADGTTANGRIATIIGIVFVIIVGLAVIAYNKKERSKA